MNTDKLVELFKTEVEKLEKEAYERGKRDALKVDNIKDKPKTVKRLAKVGERVLVVDAKPLYTQYTNGDIYKVKGLDDMGVDIDRNGTQLYLYHDEYEVIIEEPVQPLSANQQRKELIEQAREFITTHKNARGGISKRLGYRAADGIICDAEFVVNEEKRTVVCLLRWQFGGYITSKGIAKCHPGEVFNADIGKAIALARALEIDVPEEFLNAVQPDAVVKGMTMQILCTTGEPTEEIFEVFGFYCGYPKYVDGEYSTHHKIINDTNAEYEVR